MSDQETQAKKEKAYSYAQMMDTWAYKDFTSFMDSYKQATIQSFINFDEKDAVDLKIGELKGVLLCLRKINDYIRNSSSSSL